MGTLLLLAFACLDLYAYLLALRERPDMCSNWYKLPGGGFVYLFKVRRA